MINNHPQSRISWVLAAVTLILWGLAAILVIVEGFEKQANIINTEAQTYAIFIYLCSYLFVGFLAGVFFIKLRWKIKSKFYHKKTKSNNSPNFDNVIYLESRQ